MKRLILGLAALLGACNSQAHAAAATTSGPRPETDTPVSGYFLNLADVHRIDCAGGAAAGSGVRIDRTLVLTAWHVARLADCQIDGLPVEVVYHDEALDMAVVRAAPARDRAPISCEGIHSGRNYYAVGWALGRDFVVQFMQGTDATISADGFVGTRMLRGSMLHGMSGGGVFDEHGNLVAFIDAVVPDGRQLGAVRALSDTYLCHG